MLPSDSLHLLSVEFRQATPAVQEALAFSIADQRALLEAAGRNGLPLVIVCNPGAFHLISTSQNHVRAFRPALSCIHHRTRALEGSGAIPVRVARGGDAARYLLRQAASLAQLGIEAHDFATQLHEAGDLSAACGAFSGELAALFRMTETAAERVQSETRLGRSGSTDAELELESLVAERILEEELLAWQSSYPALRASSRPPLSGQDLGLFGTEEPQSVVRMRVARVLTRLGTG